MAAKGLWVRLYTEITRDRKLRRHPAPIRWAWITVLCMAKESPFPGTLLLSESVPVTIEDIADEAAIDVEEARQAIAVFKEQCMLTETDGVYSLINWAERQYESDNSAERTRQYRERKKKQDETSQERHSDDAVTPPEADTETETDIISSPNGDSSPELFSPEELPDEPEQIPAKQTVPYDRVVEAYHECCPSLPRIQQLTKERRRLIKKCWKGSVEPFRMVFSRAEQSDFLTGRKPSPKHPNWVANLEFILQESSWTKILEGQYDNRAAPASSSNMPRGYASIMEAVQRRKGRMQNDLRRDVSHCDGGYGGIPPDAGQRDGSDRRSMVCGAGTPR